MHEPHSLPIGSVLHGKKYEYHIENVLGQGSFGITYLAKIQLAGNLGELPTDVPVAVKEFHMRDTDGEFATAGNKSGRYNDYLKTFLHEASILSEVHHRGIVSVLEAFEGNDTTYYSMEYIEGENLNDYIQSNGCLSEQESLESIIRIIDAVSYLHSRKILHLDIKPHNILRRPDGTLALIDFGISRHFGADSITDPDSILTGGTPGYAPMEQSYYGAGKVFEPTMDIYALGGILYKMLTGNTPPYAPDIFNDGFPEESMIEKGISRDIIDLTMWAMEPMKKKRPQTVGEFLTEVKRLLPRASTVVTKKTSTTPLHPSDEATVTVPGLEECNGFHVCWSRDVTETQKSRIRDLLKAMKKIGEKELRIYTDNGAKTIGTIPVMSLGEDSWRYLWPLGGKEKKDTGNWYPLQFALRRMQQLAEWTGLPFRLPNEDEIGYESPSAGSDRRTLCYTKNRKLQYKNHGDGCLYDIERLYDWDTSYGVEAVCDGLWPAHHGTGFNVPGTLELFNEIAPVGFNLYKARKGNSWNIKSRELPFHSYLDKDFDSISNIEIVSVPGPGHRPFKTYFGIVARRSGMVYYYAFESGMFKLKEMFSEEEYQILCRLS